VAALPGVFLSDPGWIGVIVGVIAIAVAVAVAVWQTRQRGPAPITELSYLITASTLIGGRARGPLKLLFEDQELTHGRLVALVVRNTGNQPIARDAFDGPLKLVFSPGVRLLQVTVTNVHPETLQPEPRIVVVSKPQQKTSKGSPEPPPTPPPRLDIEPLTLNPSAAFALELLVDGPVNPDPRKPRGVRLIGNIVGVTEFRQLPVGPPPDQRRARRDRSSFLSTTATGIAAGAAVASIVAGVSALTQRRKTTNTRIERTRAAPLCASEYRLTDRSVLVVESKSGRLVELPRAQVRAVERNAC
jgi:hypothetical protein